MTVIDAHQHLWELDRVDYPWLGPEYGSLNQNHTPDMIAPLLSEAGIDRTVLVQCADSYADTDYMLGIAAEYDFVGGVVGWVPLDQPSEAAESLERYAKDDRFVGVRHLIHTLPDPDWVVRPEVIDGLRILADHDLTFDVVAVGDRQLSHVSTLAEKVPRLRLVIDHLAKPPIAERGWQPWSDNLAKAAGYPNVYAKISGLNTAADMDNWTADDLRPYVERALELFGADRLMYGGDWPITTMAGGYLKVWEAVNGILDGLKAEERRAILGETALRFYRLPMQT